MRACVRILLIHEKFGLVDLAVGLAAAAASSAAASSPAARRRRLLRRRLRLLRRLRRRLRRRPRRLPQRLRRRLLLLPLPLHRYRRRRLRLRLGGGFGAIANRRRQRLPAARPLPRLRLDEPARLLLTLWALRRRRRALRRPSSARAAAAKIDIHKIRVFTRMSTAALCAGGGRGVCTPGSGGLSPRSKSVTTKSGAFSRSSSSTSESVQCSGVNSSASEADAGSRGVKSSSSSSSSAETAFQGLRVFEGLLVGRAKHWRREQPRRATSPGAARLAARRERSRVLPTTISLRVQRSLPSSRRLAMCLAPPPRLPTKYARDRWLHAQSRGGN